MLIHYVDWWDEEQGKLRCHFGKQTDARKYAQEMRKTSSGDVELRKAEFSSRKGTVIEALNMLGRGSPLGFYPGGHDVRVQLWKPPKKRLREYEGDGDVCEEGPT